MLQIQIKLSLLSESKYITKAKIKMRQYVIFSKPRKFDIADIECLSIPLGDVKELVRFVLEM